MDSTAVISFKFSFFICSRLGAGGKARYSEVLWMGAVNDLSPLIGGVLIWAPWGEGITKVRTLQQSVWPESINPRDIFIPLLKRVEEEVSGW